MAEIGVPDAHALALTGHANPAMQGQVHFTTYVHTGRFSVKVLKESIDKLAETYREVVTSMLPPARLG
jgi:hypothetical protein